jgi:tartrate dehydratase beta subunit/fumarate hydratase class I family protein
MAEYHLETPLSEEDVRKLKLGDVVYLSGALYGGSGLVSRIIEAIKKGEKLPFDLKGAVYSYGFTTSARYQVPMPELIKYAGIRAITGKGSVNKPALDAMKTYGCVYLSGVGGSADVYRRPEMVGDRVPTDWPVPEGDVNTNLTKQEVVEYGPLFVTMDANGHSVETEIRIEEKLPKIYKKLGVHDVKTPYHL